MTFVDETFACDYLTSNIFVSPLFEKSHSSNLHKLSKVLCIPGNMGVIISEVIYYGIIIEVNCNNVDKKSWGGSPGELSEELVSQEKRKKGWRMNCDVGAATEGLENEL